MHQLKVLVDHSYSKFGRYVRVCNLDLFTINQNLSCIWRISTKKHRHKSTLSRSILSKDGKDFILLHFKVNVVVGYNARECLCNP